MPKGMTEFKRVTIERLLLIIEWAQSNHMSSWKQTAFFSWSQKMQQEKLEVWEELDLLLLAGSGAVSTESMRRNVGHLQEQTSAPTDRQRGNKDHHPTTANTGSNCHEYVWKQMLPQRLQLNMTPVTPWFPIYEMLRQRTQAEPIVTSDLNSYIKKCVLSC